jgi:hypothetical protein
MRYVPGAQVVVGAAQHSTGSFSCVKLKARPGLLPPGEYELEHIQAGKPLKYHFVGHEGKRVLEFHSTQNADESLDRLQGLTPPLPPQEDPAPDLGE